MSPPPSEWATDLANEIVPEGVDLAAMWEAVRVDVARALDNARVGGAEAMQTAAVLTCARHPSANWAAAAIIRIDAAELAGRKP